MARNALDPLGKVFEYKGRYAGNLPSKISFLESLFSLRILESLEAKGVTCKFSKVSDISVDGFDLLIEQHALWAQDWKLECWYN